MTTQSTKSYHLWVCSPEGGVVMSAAYDPATRRLGSLCIDTGANGLLSTHGANAVRCASLAVSGLEHQPDRVEELEAEVRRLRGLLELERARCQLEGARPQATEHSTPTAL